MNQTQKTMKVMAAKNNTVTLSEAPLPQPGPNDLLIKMVTASVNSAEEKVMGGDFTGRFLHANTQPLVLGWDYAGVVEAVGEDVTDLKAGANVFGHLEFSNKQTQGVYGEYIKVDRSMVGEKPAEVSNAIAAASATSALTALQSLRDLGQLKQGDEVLIIGAGGGVGALAVGIAKKLGGFVTGFCSAKDVQKVKDLGADHVIDRSQGDPFSEKSKYKVIFDTPAVYSFGLAAKSLTADGSFVTTLPNLGFITGKMRAIFSSKKVHFVEVAPKREDLELLASWLAEGLTVPIDSTYKITDLNAALERQKDRTRSGQIVVEFGEWG